ncbi:uncharacterized protein METZ01_LOCUS482821, partial [marine metagenome]
VDWDLVLLARGIGHSSFSRVTQTRTGVHRGTEVYEIV